MSVIFDGRLHVYYGQADLHAARDNPPDFQDAVRGQRNGLCGAAERGRLLLLTGLHSGYVGFRMEACDLMPAPDDTWEEIVEVSFQAPSSDVGELGLYDLLYGKVVCHVPLAPGQTYRARYCARDMARGKEADVVLPEEELADFYYLVFWPAPFSADAVLKQTSEVAAYWHDHARSLPPRSPHPAA